MVLEPVADTVVEPETELEIAAAMENEPVTAITWFMFEMLTASTV